jgi:hypothetical protein
MINTLQLKNYSDRKKQGRVIFVEIISRTKKNNKERQYLIIYRQRSHFHSIIK